MLNAFSDDSADEVSGISLKYSDTLCTKLNYRYTKTIHSIVLTPFNDPI